MTNRQPHLNGQMGDVQIQGIKSARTISGIIMGIFAPLTGILALTVGTAGFFFALSAVVLAFAAGTFFFTAGILMFPG